MKIHMTAIGGTGMGAVAGLLSGAGHEVRGSDGPLYPPMSTLLEQLGIPVSEGFDPRNLDWGPDLVVLGNTCSSQHIEYLEAQRRGLRVLSFPEILSERFLTDRHCVVIAGTHGKTTTSSLVAHLLHAAGLDPGFFIGGIPGNFGKGFALGAPPLFVLEGDEYDSACFDKRPKFVHYRPETVILTGVEFDHADIYADIDAVAAAFAQLIERIPEHGRLFVSTSSDLALQLSERAACPVERYAVVPTSQAKPRADWIGEYSARGSGDRTRLSISHRDTFVGHFELPMSGAHNAANALAAVAVGTSCGIDPSELATGLCEFAGVARRQQVRGVADGVTVIDDFAHHPTAVAATLEALRNVHGSGRLIAVLEPRSATSRRNVFQKQWPEALSQADTVLIAPLYQPHKIAEDQRLDVDSVVSELLAMGKTARLLDVAGMVEYLSAESEHGDTVVVMSSGGFDGLIDKLLAALGGRASLRPSPS